MHSHANGSEVAHGVYVVTAFKSFANGGGTLVGAGPTDGIDVITKTTGGLLTLIVQLHASSGLVAEGVLEVHCDLIGTKPPEEEGVRLTVLTFNFVRAGGFTLFHVLDD